MINTITPLFLYKYKDHICPSIEPLMEHYQVKEGTTADEPLFLCYPEAFYMGYDASKVIYDKEGQMYRRNTVVNNLNELGIVPLLQKHIGEVKGIEEVSLNGKTRFVFRRIGKWSFPVPE